MSYDQIGDEIGKLRTQLNQRKTYFQDAKSNLKELENLYSGFDSNSVDYDKKQYDKAVSAINSGAYLEAIDLVNEAKANTQNSLSAMKEVKILEGQLLKQIEETKKYQNISFQHDDLNEVGKLISKGDFILATSKINEIFDVLNELIDSKGLAIEKIDQLVSEYSKSKAFVNLDNFQSKLNSIQKLLDKNDFSSAISDAEEFAKNSFRCTFRITFIRFQLTTRTYCTRME